MRSVNKKMRKAAAEGDEAGLEICLAHPKCDPMSKGDGGLTALMEAASYGHVSCTQRLLPVSDALAQSVEGLTALMWATSFGSAACVQLLLPVSDPLARDKGGRTALIFAAMWQRSDCIQLLLPVSDFLVKDSRGMTASDHARDVGSAESAALMEAYVLSMSEAAALEDFTKKKAHRKSAPARI